MNNPTPNRFQMQRSSSEHERVLKGLLKPFKGKGDFDLWREQLHQLATELRTKMQLQSRQGLLDVQRGMPLKLVIQRGHDARRRYLRWRSVDDKHMGFLVLLDAVASSSLTVMAKRRLLEQEIERIALNMQLGSLMALVDCAERAYEQFNRLEELRDTLRNSGVQTKGENNEYHR